MFEVSCGHADDIILSCLCCIPQVMLPQVGLTHIRILFTLQILGSDGSTSITVQYFMVNSLKFSKEESYEISENTPC